MKVAVTREVFEDVLSTLREHFEVKCNQRDEPLAGARLAEFIGDSDGALTTLTDRVDAQVIADCPNLKAIVNAAAGHNNVDISACTDNGILVSNVPDVVHETTADLTFGLIVAAARRITEAERHLRAGRWQRWAVKEFLGAEVYGSTLGIVGMGRIGRAVAKRARGFDMRVLYHNRIRLDSVIEANCRAQYASLDTLLAEADFLVLSLSYSASSHHLIGARELARMQRNAVLINVARGGVVDEVALVAALADGVIAAAALDVYENEPSVRQELLALPNLVLTPHIGSASESTRRRMCHTAAKDLIAALETGNATNLVNKHCRPSPTRWLTFQPKSACCGGTLG